jgi:hypothetical protein
LVNGRAISITENIWSAFLHLRRTKEPRLLWADALCIDQNNIEERSHQVSLIPEIYKNESTVISWLGLENADVISMTLKFLLKLRSDSFTERCNVTSTHSGKMGQMNRSATFWPTVISLLQMMRAI